MRYFVFSSIIFMSTYIYSEELCPNLDIKVELEYWMTAEAFNDESALWALAKLKSIVTGEIKLKDEFLKDIARANAFSVLKGYFLREEALREQAGSILDEGATDFYCDYLKHAAWVD